MTLAKSFLENRKKQLSENGITFEVFTIDASTNSAESIFTQLDTPSFFSNHKIIFIKRVTENKDKESLIESITEYATVERENAPVDLIVWEAIKLPKNLRFMKKLSAHNAIVESPELDDPQKPNKRLFKSWAGETVRSSGIKMSSDTVFLLSERANYNTESFTREISKLSLLGKKIITEEDIETYCPDTLEHTIWQLIDAINENDASNAETHLDSVLRQGNDPHFLLVMLARNIRLILLTKVLSEQNLNVYQIAKKIKAPPFTIASIQRKAKDMPLERIATLYDKLANIDYSEKTGQLDISLALHILISVI